MVQTYGGFKDSVQELCRKAGVSEAGVSAVGVAIGLSFPSLTELMPFPVTAAVLKELTGFTVRNDNGLNCYPRGFTTTVLFDQVGNPLD